MTVYLVTGGNRGIGAGIVEGIAKSSTKEDIIILTSRGDSGIAVADNLNLQHGKDNIFFHKLDVQSDESVKALGEWIKDKYGRLDVLVNNAGYAIKGSGFNEEIAFTTINTNYFGVMRMCNEMLPLMKENSRIINVSSAMGIITDSYSREIKDRLMSENINVEELNKIYEEFMQSIRDDNVEKAGFPRSTYRVSKVLLNGYGRFLYRTVGEPRKIFIASVDPGWVRTDMGGENATLSIEEGSDTIIWLATAPLNDLKNGEFWAKRKTRSWTN